MNAFAMTYIEPLGHAVPARQVKPPAKLFGVAETQNHLLNRLRRGDEHAFESLVNQYHAALIRMAMRYVGDRGSAEEVVQDTWIAVINGLHNFEGQSSLSTWIFAILIHKAKDRGVRESRHITFSDFESCDGEKEAALDPSRFHQSGELAGQWALPPQPWNEQTPERLLASKQAIEALSKAIDELPPSLQEVIVLRDVEGFESPDICQLLKITETNLYVRLHRARERVRQTLEASQVGLIA
jgi:RNA polymerase sigma-70 factor (ECF subfamily)